MLKAHSEKRGYRHKKEDLKLMRYVFNSILNESFEDIFLKWDGNEFQSDGPARAKARSPQDL